MNLIIQLVSSSWFWADVLLSVSGGVVVAWGLRIEKKAEEMMPPSDFGESRNAFADIVEKQKREEERGWRILMTGIVMEVVAAFIISVISGLEIADSNSKSSAATLEAKNAEKQTAEVILNNLALRTNVDSLSIAVLNLAHEYDLSTNALAEADARLAQAHSEASELEAKLKPRIITQAQHDVFVQFLKSVPLLPDDRNTWIICSSPNGETSDFLNQVRKMLDDAGYGATSGMPFQGGLAIGSWAQGVLNSFGFSTALRDNASVGVLVPTGVPQPSQSALLAAAFNVAGIRPIFVSVDQSSLKTNSTAVFVPTK
jgi:hypothetical protein